MIQVFYSASVWKGGAYRPVISKVLTNPCNNVPMHKLLKTFAKADGNCLIKMAIIIPST